MLPRLDIHKLKNKPSTKGQRELCSSKQQLKSALYYPFLSWKKSAIATSRKLDGANVLSLWLQLDMLCTDLERQIRCYKEIQKSLRTQIKKCC